MGSRLWNIFKKEISLVAVFTFLYQLILLPRTVLFGVTGGVTGVFLGIVLIFAGYIIAGYITKKEQNFRSMLLSYLSAIAAAVIIAIIYWIIAPELKYGGTQFINMLNWKSVQSLKIVFEGLGAFILYFVGVRTRFLEHDLILSRNKLIFGAIIFISAIIFMQYYSSIEYLKRTVYTFVYVFIAISLLIKNQQNLDNAFIKKHIDLSTVPKNIRNYNSIIVMVLFALIIIIFNIKELVDFIVYIIGNIPRTIVLFMLKALELLSKLLPGGEGEGGSQGGSPDMSGLPEGEENAIVAIITKIIFGIILVAAGAFAIWKLPALFAAIGRKIKKLGNFIAELFKKLFLIQKDSLDKEIDYIDEVITIKPTSHSKEERESKKKIQRMGGRLWKNADYMEKIRFMYKLTVNYIIKSGIDIKRSDTTKEIYQKALEIDGLQESLGFATDIYNKIRYGGKVPDDAEYIKFEEKFSSTVDILKKK